MKLNYFLKLSVSTIILLVAARSYAGSCEVFEDPTAAEYERIVKNSDANARSYNELRLAKRTEAIKKIGQNGTLKSCIEGSVNRDLSFNDLILSYSTRKGQTSGSEIVVTFWINNGQVIGVTEK